MDEEREAAELIPAFKKRTTTSFTSPAHTGNNLTGEVNRYSRAAGSISKEYNFDVIHVYDWITFPTGIVAKRNSKKPLVVYMHSTEVDRAGDQITEGVFNLEKQNSEKRQDHSR